MARHQTQRQGAAGRGRKPVRSQPGQGKGSGAAVDRDAPTSYRPMGAGLTVQEVCVTVKGWLRHARWLVTLETLVADTV